LSKKNSAPPAPDTSAISNAQAAAAATNTKNAQDQLQWAKDAATKNQGTTDQVVQNALTRQSTLNNSASNDRTAYEGSAYPALQNEINDAATYASAGKKDLDIGAAQSAVGQNFDAARNNSTQALEAYGVNPADTRFAALDIGARSAEAAAKAAAGTTASNNVDATARALNHQVYTDAAPLANQSLTESNAAGAAGTGAVNNNLATTANGASTMGTAPQFGSLAATDLSGQANTVNTGYKNQLDAAKINQSASSGVGSALGLIGTVGGSLIGGPAGGAIGSALGSFAGTALGGSDGGTAASPADGLSASDYGTGSNAGSTMDQYGLHAAAGGAIGDPDATPGGAIPMNASPTGGKAVDDVPARLTVGEFVIPKDVAAWKGQEHFQKLIQQSRKAAQEAQAKPAVGPAVGGPTTFQSRPQQGAIPMSRAA
jgi:hypothetical protein